MARWVERLRANWRGELRLGDRWATWRGEVGKGTLHRHFAAQAVLSATPIRVFDVDGAYLEACCVLIDPLVPHRISSGGEALLIYLEPGAPVNDELQETLRPIRLAAARAILSSSTGSHFWAEWLTKPTTSSIYADQRIVDALVLIEEALSEGALPLSAAAARSGLSADRFRHLFAEQIGTPYMRYVLWRRLRLAAAELAAGQDVTTSAHAAGFADAPHFARTLKSTFGITASQALLAR